MTDKLLDAISLGLRLLLGYLYLAGLIVTLLVGILLAVWLGQYLGLLAAPLVIVPPVLYGWLCEKVPQPW